jgi:hypothetical protein
MISKQLKELRLKNLTAPNKGYMQLKQRKATIFYVQL